jgi:anaerobic magnesium-protoporphyrin IX monomethyl ester cyclase
VLILLTHANHLFSDRKQVQKMQPYPPLQTLIAAAVLRAQGFEVALFDVTFDRDYVSALDRYRPDLVAVCEDNFNYLTKMCLLQNRELALEIAAACAARGIPAVINSSDATDRPNLYLSAGFSRVIFVELESTLADLCRQWPRPVAGAAGLDQGVLRHGPPRPPIANLDELPSPAWDLLDMNLYRDAWNAAHGYFSLNLAISRGCPYRCNWCSKPLYGDTYRHCSPRRAAAELKLLKTRFRPDRVWFADDIFGLSGKWTREFAADVERYQAHIPFRMQSRCDLMTRDTVEALKRAGCQEVWMGAESGSQRILDAMDKGIRVEQIREARENLRRHGIRACFFLQLGYLGEEWEDLENTVRLVREIRPDDIGVSVSYPLPNTRFHRIVAQQIGAKSNWSESGDLAMMFHGAFSTEFYRALADILHCEVRSGGAPPEAWDKLERLSARRGVRDFGLRAMLRSESPGTRAASQNPKALTRPASAGPTALHEVRT